MKNLKHIFENHTNQIKEKIEQSKTPKEAIYHLQIILDDGINEYKDNLTIPQARVLTPFLEILRGSIGCLDAVRTNEIKIDNVLSASIIPSEHKIGPFAQKQIEFVVLILMLLLLLSALSTSWVVGVTVALGLSLVAMRLAQIFVKPAKRLVSKKPSVIKFDAEALIETLRDNISIFDRTSDALIEMATPDVKAINNCQTVDLDIIELFQQLLADQKTQEPDKIYQNLNKVKIVLKRMKLKSLWYENTLSDEQKIDFEQVIDPRVKKPICLLPAIIGEQGTLLDGRIAVPKA